MTETIPAELVVELHVRPIRGQETRIAESQQAVMEAFESGDEERAQELIGIALREGSQHYLRWLDGQSRLERRLHLLVWPLEPFEPEHAAAFAIEGGPERARAIVAAMREAGLDAAAARYERIVQAAAGFDETPEEGEAANRLEALSLDFDSTGRYRDELRAAFAADPETARLVEAWRGRLDEDDRLDAAFQMVGERIGEAFASSAMDGLNEAERLVFLALAFEYEVDNGGVAQFFESDSGNLAAETAAALRVIGCEAEAATVLRGVAMFPAPYPRDADERLDRMQRARGKLGEKLDRLTDEIDVDEIRPAVIGKLKKLNALPR